MNTIDTLHTKFCEFIEVARRFVDAPPITAPTFHLILDDKPPPHIDGPLPYPFEEFWLNTATRDGLSVVCYVRRIDDDRTILRVYHYDGRKFRPLPVTDSRAAGWFRTCLRFIAAAADRDESEPEQLTAINRGRAKSKNGLAPIPKFITIRPRAVAKSPVEHHGGGGWTQRPHSRRGHYRTYSSGKRNWVRDHVIHGGAETGRHYRVEV
jgi:hypothetical protein